MTYEELYKLKYFDIIYHKQFNELFRIDKLKRTEKTREVVGANLETLDGKSASHYFAASQLSDWSVYGLGDVMLMVKAFIGDELVKRTYNSTKMFGSCYSIKTVFDKIIAKQFNDSTQTFELKDCSYEKARLESRQRNTFS